MIFISTLEDVQYCVGCLVLWEDINQYVVGCSVLWRMFSTVEDFQYCGGCLVLCRMFSTV